ncbi:hypothetical protein ERJ75_001191900 [Trypanosoma vivax]|uniref:Elongin-C n=1 Tax=Trypanosoma vivax (strain Y486) TaxID=1055687 RepID=G0UBX1_TRYVY|nr:hypothetical protein TRVL_06626 [Trypanosoma vivax]KAH8609450.1 hypothetical protein ERJ75_001191300 [Trypanosoma vivax]KAH8609590.1 hypothetical protein ERJ75_001191900 [Trypanosoma vivax]CCC53319.1 conserved hypothetical protein [Trypanosoma vivax Y486]
MSRGAVPFNPMRRTPPPTPCIDTYNLDPSEYIHMTSADGHKFVLHRECACVSPLIRKSLADHLGPTLPELRVEWSRGDEELPAIHFLTAPAPLLEMVVQYMYYKHRYEGDAGERPPFDVPADLALDLMRLASVLLL